MASGASRTIVQLPIARIRVGPGRRPIDEAHVANLMVSIGDVGLRQAIGVRRLDDESPARPEFSYDLGAGGHRLEAHRRLGRKVIDAVIEDDDDHTAKIAEVDENLIRRDLNALERAQALAARLEAWSAQNPDRAVVGEGGAKPKRGRPTKMPHGAAISTMGFAEETAAKAGLSRDTIERDLAIYRGIPAGLQAQLLGTHIAANPGLLRQLAAMGDKGEQAGVAAHLIDGTAKTVADGMALVAGNTPSKAVQTPVDASVKAFRKVWADATPSGRAAILNDLAGRPLPKGWSVREGVDA